MKRKAQLWEFCDIAGDPFGVEIPRHDLHALFMNAAVAGAQMNYQDRKGYHAMMQAVPGSNPHFVLYNIRDDNWPYKYHGGQMVAFDPDEIDGLGEASHFLVTSGNYVLAMTNGYSPKPGRFAGYLRDRLDGWQDVYVQPVLRHDAARVLAHMSRVKRIRLAIQASRIDQLAPLYEDSDDPLRIFEVSQHGQGGVMEVSWSVGVQRDADPGKFKKFVKSLGRRDLSLFNRAQANLLVADAEDEEQEMMVDFLRQKIVAEVDVGDPLAHSKHISAHGAIAGLKEALELFRESDNLDFGNPDQVLVCPASLRQP